MDNNTGNKVSLDADGTTYWRNVDNFLHRDHDLPAIEWPDGGKQWWKKGRRHRDGGLPAVERIDGSKEWYVDGLPHRDGGLPAVERVDGGKEWWIKGERQ